MNRVLSEPTAIYSDQHLFTTGVIRNDRVSSRPTSISIKFYLIRVLSGLTEFHLYQVISRPSFISSTNFYLDRPSLISTEFYLDRVLSRRPSFTWTDRVTSRRVLSRLSSFILTYRDSYRPSFISPTKFYMDQPSFIATKIYINRVLSLQPIIIRTDLVLFGSTFIYNGFYQK